MITSDARDTLIIADRPYDPTARRVRELVGQLNDASDTIDALLRMAVRDRDHEAVGLYEASQAVHRAVLALTPPETRR